MKKSMVLFLILFHIFWFNAFAQDYRTHTVEKGDTVYNLAKKYHTTEEAIYELNPGSENGIKLGAVLVLPPKKLTNGNKEPLRFKEYTVKPKETVFGISQQNAIDMADLKKYNPYLYKEELGIGDTIKIPIYTKKKPEPIDYNQSIKNSTFGNLKHVVLPGETKYGIARKYGLELEGLRRLNPGMDSLQPGDVLVVSKKEKPKWKTPELPDRDKFEYYIVGNYDEGSPETIYSLTRKFGIGRDSLYALNPMLKTDGLEAGMKLIVPKGTTEKFNTFEAETVDLENRIEYTDTKDLVLMLPFKLNEIQSDSLELKKGQLQEERILRISLDFYSGVLMALEKAREKGISVNLKIYDTQQSKGKVSSIIQNNDFEDVDAVIGPLLSDMVESVAQQLERKQIPVFSPLTSQQMVSHKNLFQTRPSEEWMQDVMISFLNNIHNGQNIIILTDGKHGARAQKLKNVFPMAHGIVETGNYMDGAKLEPVLSKTGENWVILESGSVAMMGSAVAQLSIMDSEERKIRLFTTVRNDAYESDEINNTYLGNLNFTFPSIAWGFNEERAKGFTEKYIEEHGVKPSKYAVRGFDLTYDILLRLAAFGDIHKSLGLEGATEYAENKFHYVEKENGGYVNNAVYVLHYGSDLEVKPVSLSKGSNR